MAIKLDKTRQGVCYKSTATAIQIKEASEGALPIITVKFASFGNLDHNGDIMIAGSFKKSIDDFESGIVSFPFLDQHSTREVIGRVIKLWETADGAYADIEMTDPEVSPTAKRVLWQLQHGHLTKFSFGFKYIWEMCQWHDDDLSDTNSLIVGGVELKEVSVVTFPANDNTSFLGSKELTEPTPKEPTSWLHQYGNKFTH